MNRAHFTDADLLKASIKQWPWLSIVFSVLQIAFFLLVDGSQSDVAFGLNLPQSGLKRELAFNLLAPWNHGGLPIITSLFVHADARHFFTNLPYLIIFSVFLEKRSRAVFLFVAIIAGHLTALAGAALAMTFLGAPQLVLGSSGSAIAIAFALLVLRNKKIALWAGVVAAFVLLAIGKALFLSHLPPLIAGIGLGFTLHRSQMTSLQRPE